MPNFNPFSSDNEDTSFETGMPVSQAANTAVKAISSQAQAQIDATNQDIVNQLYGPSTPDEPGTDEANQSHVDQSNAATRAQSAHMSASMSANKGSKTNQTANQNTNQTPEEQAKMEKIRHELFGNYSATYQSAPNAAHGLITNLDQEMDKARKEREQKETQRKQEEEEEEKRKKEEEEEQKQELVSPAGKKTGFTFGKKPQQPIALRLAKTKTEINRGATG